MAGNNPLEMSDEDIMNMTAPPEPSASAGGEGASADDKSGEAGEQQTAQVEGAGEGDKTGEEGSTEVGEKDGEGTEGAGADELGGEGDKDGDKDPAEGEDQTGDKATGSTEGDKPTDKTGEKKDDKQEEQTPPNYQAFYEQIMKPFKANGKTIELKSPEEAIGLMQMGANYTRKMQEIVPHRKALTMLQNNGLLDESKLSFLIDLDKGDKEAVKKLLKDKGIDPLDIDTSVDPAYVDGNHKVTDAEVSFRDALDELSSNPNGKETLQIINTRWDQASKDLLWDKPETLKIIQDQRDLGIYDRIAAEIDRQVTLGKIPANMPFLQAYKIVGDELTASNGFADLIQKHQSGTATQAESGGVAPHKEDPKVVATRVAAPKSPVSNDDKASAASPTRTTPAKAKEFVNPLAMSDDEFMKKFEGRL